MLIYLQYPIPTYLPTYPGIEPLYLRGSILDAFWVFISKQWRGNLEAKLCGDKFH